LTGYKNGRKEYKMIDKNKLERALKDFGLSEKRAQELSNYLSDKDLTSVGRRKKKKEQEQFYTTETINEVVKEE
jgi:hypothetical protein